MLPGHFHCVLVFSILRWLLSSKLAQSSLSSYLRVLSLHFNKARLSPRSTLVNIMTVGSFPPFSSVREIKEFDGSAEKLSDFITSVESHIATYNLPVSQGGYVSGDVDNGWNYISLADAMAQPASCRLNYNFGYRFCLLLAECFVGSAWEWWITRKMYGVGPEPNCWIEAPVNYFPLNVIQTSFRSTILNQFGNPLDREMAIAALQTLC